MIRVENTHHTYFNCLESCVTGVLNYLEKDYMSIFCRAWRMKYEPPYNNLKLLIGKYCSADFIENSFSDYETFRSYAMNQLNQEIPVIFFTNMYFLPWLDQYKKTKAFDHYVILTGYCTEDDCFYVTDFFKGIDNEKLNIREIVNNFTNSINITDLLNRSLDIRGVFEIMPIKTMIIKKRDSSKSAFSYDEFIIDGKNAILEDLTSGLNYEEMVHIIKHKLREKIIVAIDEQDMEGAFYLEYLRWLGRGRITFAEMLTFYSKSTGNNVYDTLAVELKYLGAKYFKIRLKAMKSTVKKTWYLDYEESYKDFIQVILEEQKVYDEFLSIVTMRKGRSVQTVNLKDARANIVPLSKYFNDNAFNSYLYEDKSGFDTAGGYFYISNQNSIKIDIGECIVDLSTDSYLDNIACVGDVIDLNYDHVLAIDVLGSSDSGYFADSGELKFADGSKTLITLNFSDWWDCAGTFNDEKVCSCTCGKIINSSVEKMGKVGIFRQRIYVDACSSLLSIRLPDCCNMHVFAIVVYTVD